MGRAIWMFSAIVIAVATLTPSKQEQTGSALCVICGDLAGVDILLNVLLFVPLGAGLALACVRASRAIPAMVAGTVAIEALQLFAIPGRDASLGDVLANSVGGAIGFMLGANAARLLWPDAGRARRLLAGWMGLWLAIQAMGSFVLRADPSRSVYFGQIARDLGGHPPYSGVVIEPRINGDLVPNRALPAAETERVRDALLSEQGLRLEVSVVPGSATNWPSPIVRVADHQEREILVLAAEGSSLVFGTRSRAARLRLRSPFFRLGGVFLAEGASATNAEDTIRIAATRTGHRADLSVSDRHGTRRQTIVLTPSGFWRFFSPERAYTEGSAADRVADAAWLFVLLVPAGYWAWYARRSSSSREALAISASFALALVIGFFAIPAGFRVGLPSWSDWLAAIVALIVGMAVARRSMRPSIHH